MPYREGLNKSEYFSLTICFTGRRVLFHRGEIDSLPTLLLAGGKLLRGTLVGGVCAYTPVFFSYLSFRISLFFGIIKLLGI